MREQLKTEARLRVTFGSLWVCARSLPSFPNDLFLAPQMRKRRRRRMKALCGRELLKRRFDWVGT